MKYLVHNIKAAKGIMTGNLSKGTPVRGEYSINQYDEVTLKYLTVYEQDGSYELGPDEIDFLELEDVISAKLGNFKSTVAQTYLTNTEGA